jgi:hypothetical protein
MQAKGRWAGFAHLASACAACFVAHLKGLVQNLTYLNSVLCLIRVTEVSSLVETKAS